MIALLKFSYQKAFSENDTSTDTRALVFSALFFHHGFFRQNSLNLASFSFLFEARASLAQVTPDRVRNRINLSSSDIGDSVVNEFIQDATAEVESETGLIIDYNNCTQVEASCITDLAALYCLTYLTGGSTSGTSFTLGDLSVREVTGGVEAPSPAFLQQRVLKMIETLKPSDFRTVEA